MRELAGKTAFVTGGASGIGLALGRAFAEAGMKVMLADIEAGALADAVTQLSDLGRDVCGIACDVADPASVEHAAKESFERFGNVHILCNNAGVAAAGGVEDISLENWRWVLDVNLMGVVHGIRAFLPHIRAHGEGGHIVNTASMAGMNNGLGFSPYSASKFAVVNISEGLAARLEPLGIGVTVLAPALSAPALTRVGAIDRNDTVRHGCPTRRARLASCAPGSPNLHDQGSTRRMSPSKSFRPSRTTNFMFLRIPAPLARGAGRAVWHYLGGNGQGGNPPAGMISALGQRVIADASRERSVRRGDDTTAGDRIESI
jgi:NAD(P)-dependent dehydrogenase (short-subunit alcohol dehydrogenase family)